MNYIRVLPRDAFNEAKLLKCIGALLVLIVDELCPLCFEYRQQDQGFLILQDQSDGGLYVSNLTVRTTAGKRLCLRSRANSKSAYPLDCYDDNGITTVFDDEGQLTEEFRRLVGMPIDTEASHASTGDDHSRAS